MHKKYISLFLGVLIVGSSLPLHAWEADIRNFFANLALSTSIGAIQDLCDNVLMNKPLMHDFQRLGSALAFGSALSLGESVGARTALGRTGGGITVSTVATIIECCYRIESFKRTPSKVIFALCVKAALFGIIKGSGYIFIKKLLAKHFDTNNLHTKTL